MRICKQSADFSTLLVLWHFCENIQSNDMSLLFPSRTFDHTIAYDVIHLNVLLASGLQLSLALQ